jgi:phosphoenolpyruvate-protein kinase (PTS system EI component)
MCGETAGNPDLAEPLLGLGFDEVIVIVATRYRREVIIRGLQPANQPFT